MIKKSKKALSKARAIPLWDRCIMLIAVIILFECGYIALFESVGNAHDTSIDVVLRAAVSSLLGYILSANFLNDHRIRKEEISGDFGQANLSGGEDFISLNTPETQVSENKAQTSEAERPDRLRTSENRDEHWEMRIKIVTAISVFSVGMLIVLRNMVPEPADSTPFITMFANMTSASVGYLIGYLPGKKNSG